MLVSAQTMKLGSTCQECLAAQVMHEATRYLCYTSVTLRKVTYAFEETLIVCE